MNDNMKNLREAEEFILDLKSHKADKYFSSLATKYVDQLGATPSEEPETDEMSITRMDAKMKAAIFREDAKTKRSKIFGMRGGLAACFVAACFVAAYLLIPGENFMDFFRDDVENPTVAGVYEVVDYEHFAHGRLYGIDGDFLDTDEFWESVPLAPESDTPVGAIRGYTFGEEFSFSDIGRIVALLPPEGWQITFESIDETASVFHFQSDEGNIVYAVLGEPVYDPTQAEFREVIIDQTTAYLLTEPTHSILFFDILGRQVVLSAGENYWDLIALAEFWVGYTP